MVIDISKHQKTVDFTKVKPNVKAVIIRIGYRGYASAGTIVKDEFADRNIKECIAKEIPFGIYFFSQAKNFAEGVAEAEWTLNEIKKYSVQPVYPVYIDTEWANNAHNGRADGISVADRTQAMLGFLQTIEANGYYAGIYASTSWFTSKVDDKQLLKYTHWVADYRGYCGYAGKKDMWQYTSTATVNGISGSVDANVCYADFPAIVKEKGLNGYKSEPIYIDAEPIRLIIGYASYGDIKALTGVLDGIGNVDYEVDDGFIYTSLMSAGDQSKVVAKCKELGIPVKEYKPVTVLAPEEETEVETTEEAKNGLTAEQTTILKFIRWLMKLFKIDE